MAIKKTFDYIEGRIENIIRYEGFISLAKQKRFDNKYMIVEKQKS